MLKRELLLAGCAIAVMLSGQETWAAEACTAVPTCTELGYTQTTCNGFFGLKCPFDKTKLFCGLSDCESGYYKYSDTECILGNRQVIKSGSAVIGVAVSSNLAVAMTDEGKMTWGAAVGKCNAKTTGGKSWRLPKKDEVAAMKDTYKATYATLQLNGGKGMRGLYWTPESASDGAGVSPADGTSGSYGGSVREHYVRCVFSF